MTRFKLNAMLDEQYSQEHLWEMIRFCYEIPEKNLDFGTSIVLCALERLAMSRNGEPVDANLANSQDSSVRILAKKALAGNSNAMKELAKMRFKKTNF